MAPANLNAWWCQLIADALITGGVRDVITCPGNRNVPLLFAFNEQPGLRLIPHVDERSGAFLALGLARAAKRPVAICTTSGSAVANLLPACCEAYHAGIPLVLITADRPEELHGCGAPQTMRQTGVLAPFCIDEFNTMEPIVDGRLASDMRTKVIRLLGRGCGASPGPVHLNVPLDEPLAPLPDPHFHAPPMSPHATPPRPAQTTAALTSSATPLRNAILRPGLRGVIVAGPELPITIDEVRHLVTTTGFPLIADAPSGLRLPDMPHVVTTADAILSVALRSAKPELIIRLGPAPIARPTCEWLQAQSCMVLRIDRHPVERDFCHRQFEPITRPSPGELVRLGEHLTRGDDAWLDQWMHAQDRAEEARRTWLTTTEWNECTAAALACKHPGFKSVNLANSMSVRHGNLHITSESERAVYANRGLNGIDGTLGTFLGTLHAQPDQPGLLLTGDLALLHDLPALAAARRPHLHGTIVVLDNQGGGIFDLLPIHQIDRFKELVRTPPSWSPEAIVAGFGLATRRCHDAASLSTALTWSQSQPGVQVIIADVTAGNVRDPFRTLIGCLNAAAIINVDG